jgi:hypothetical protein
MGNFDDPDPEIPTQNWLYELGEKAHWAMARASDSDGDGVSIPACIVQL